MCAFTFFLEMLHVIIGTGTVQRYFSFRLFLGRGCTPIKDLNCMLLSKNKDFYKIICPVYTVSGSGPICGREVRNMYFVDRHKIEQHLQVLEKHLGIFKQSDLTQSDVSLLALERLAQVLTDSVLDVGNLLIDGFIMRDPGSYDDIIDILLDEKVITPDMEGQFKRILPLRKMIVQEYLEMDHDKIQSVFLANLDAIERFPGMVRNYLQTELGPVSAFRN